MKTPKSNYATPEKIKKKEKSTPNNENLPVCKRTRTHSVSSLVKISSSTPRKEKMLEEKKRNPIIKKEQKKDIKKKKNKDERSIVEQKKNRDIAEDLIGFLPKAKKIKK